MKLLSLVIAGNYVTMTFKIASEAVEAAKSYPVMLGMMGVGFSKGGQNWPQICSTRLSF